MNGLWMKEWQFCTWRTQTCRVMWSKGKGWGLELGAHESLCPPPGALRARQVGLEAEACSAPENALRSRRTSTSVLSPPRVGVGAAAGSPRYVRAARTRARQKIAPKHGIGCGCCESDWSQN